MVVSSRTGASIQQGYRTIEMFHGSFNWNDEQERSYQLWQGGVHLNFFPPLTINHFRENVRQTIEVPTLHLMRHVKMEEYSVRKHCLE